MLAGKCLILFSILWPVPFGFIMYPWLYDKIDSQYDYWWPLPIFLVLGIVLCLISNYHSKDAFQMQSAQFKNTILWIAFKVLAYGALTIIALLTIILLLKAYHYLFLTSLVEYSVPICAGIGAVGYFSYVGYRYYQNKKNKNK